jgi:aminopeptidase N
MPMLEGRHICRHREPVSGFASKGADAHYPPDIELEPRHRDIALKIDVDSRTVEGVVTTTVEARRDGPNTLELHAVDFLDVDVSDPDGNELTWHYDGEKFRVIWQAEFSAGEARRAEIRYRLERPVAGLYFSSPDDDYPDAPRWAGTDHETERARHWLPCIDLPQVRTTLTFALRSDESFTILANGERTGEQRHDDGTKTVNWKLDFPCPSYLVCFVLGELVEYDDGEFAGLPIKYYGVAPNDSSDLARSFGRTAKIMSWMTERLGRDFPFPKYFQFAVPGIGGAMENISLVSWEAAYLLKEELEPEWRWLLDQINVHEMAHSWFGDSVVCRDFAHAWLKESWATYIETCWLEHSQGENEQRYDLWRNASAYFQEADNDYSRPIVVREYDGSFDLYDRHLYPGGACRLHTLRNLLGDETFWAGVRLYLDRFEGRNVETDDFRKVMEEVSGRSLVRFFDQWFLRAGYPALEVEWSWDDELSKGEWTFKQTQVDEKGEGPLFKELEIEVGWVVDGIMHTQKTVLNRRIEMLAVKMARKPEQVRVDPGAKTLHKLKFNPGDEMLRRQLTGSEDITGAIQAAHELAKTGKARNIDAIAQAWDKADFWGVRREFAAALAAAKTESAMQALVQIASRESDPMVLDFVFSKLGDFQDKRVVEVLRERLDGDVPPLARRAGYIAIASAGRAEQVEYLAGELRADTNMWARDGAAAGLGTTRTVAAAQPLLEMMQYGAAEHHVRAASAKALGSLIPDLPEHQRGERIDRLRIMLRDPHATTRMNAARALGSARATSAIDDLQAYARTLTAQERTDVEKIIKGLRRSESPKMKALEGEVDSLRTVIRKLEERLRQLEK